jgi:hypothetical protein
MSSLFVCVLVCYHFFWLTGCLTNPEVLSQNLEGQIAIFVLIDVFR